MNIFGIVGYLAKKMGYELGPFVLAFILGPMFENNLRQALMMSHGSFSIFFTRPIALTFLAVAFLVIISPLVFKKRIELGSDG